jgi:3,4-dihydroxy 2-butanone 4-phosphate synthase/GTP cyclohydrolase II
MKEIMVNNPIKRIGLEAYGLSIIENVPIEVVPNEFNAFYMHTKKERMGHNLRYSK